MKKNYLYTTSAIFIIVAVIHLVKLFVGFEITIAGILYPIWLSLIEILIAIYLAFIGFRLGKKE